MRIKDASSSGFDECHVCEACLEQDRPWHRVYLALPARNSLFVEPDRRDVSGHVSRLV